MFRLISPTLDQKSNKPVIDDCQTTCPAAATDGSVATGWSTLMGNCKRCEGSYNNMMFSFGGSYSGQGDISEVTNWIDNADLVANYDEFHFSNDARREAYKMYSHVSTRGSCVDIPEPKTDAPTPTTPVPTTAVPTTSSPSTTSPSDGPVSTGGIPQTQTTQSPTVSKAAKRAKTRRPMSL